MYSFACMHTYIHTYASACVYSFNIWLPFMIEGMVLTEWTWESLGALGRIWPLGPPGQGGRIATKEKATWLSGFKVLVNSYYLVITICMCTVAALLKCLQNFI